MEEKPEQLSAAILAFIVLYSGDAKDTQYEMLFNIQHCGWHDSIRKRKLFPTDSYRFSMLFTIWRNVSTVNLKHIQIRHQTPSEEWTVQLLQSESPLLKPISIMNHFPIGASEHKALLKAEKQRSAPWLKNPQAGAWANALHTHTASLQAGQQSQNGSIPTLPIACISSLSPVAQKHTSPFGIEIMLRKKSREKKSPTVNIFAQPLKTFPERLNLEK